MDHWPSALNAGQTEALHDLAKHGVLSHDQEAAVREALDEADAPKGSANRLVELLGYVGGGLLLGGAALLFAASWDDLSRVAKVVLLGAATTLFGAQHPLAGSDTAVAAYALTGVLAIASFIAYLHTHQVVLLVAGAVLLVANGVGLRLRHIR